MITINPDNQDLIFGLDIGTRTIIGIVGYRRDNKFVVVKSAIKEHEERAMIDGQVHDVSKVAYTVRCVKNEIEKAIGKTLTTVSIAAAGRVLNTQVVEVKKEYDETILFTKAYVDELELFALEIAKKNLEKEINDGSENYDCVGYSIVNYILEGQEIAQLEGQSGRLASVKLLATFLPKVVMESLKEVTRRVGLTVTHSTLEPIAAITAIIPPNLRALNLALVDVGAGTSDIAITKAGSVLSYGMIPFAGDEITEAIAQKYLLDFNVADKVKRDISSSDNIEFNDIIGRVYKVSRKEILTLIAPLVENLATLIADKLIDLNGGAPPRVIFCIGGGAQVVGLIEKIAEKAAINEEYVTLRSGEQVDSIIDEKKEVSGPQVITPYGICLVGATEKSDRWIKCKFNGEDLELIDNRKVVIMDALVAKDFKYESLFPAKGNDLAFTLNEKEILIKGDVGNAGEIWLNGKITSLDAEIKSGDKIQVIAGKKGKDATCTIGDYLEDSIIVYIEENEIPLPIFLKNGDILNPEYIIQSGDDIISIGRSDIKKLVNMFMGSVTDKFYVNGEIAEDGYILEDSDIITTKGFFENKQEPVIKEVLEIDTGGTTLDVKVNGKPVRLRGLNEYMFVNIFDFIDFDLNARRGNVALRLNGGDVSFTQLLKSGDDIEIFWQS
ncbi:cell division protein FtsA [Candidatus Epulonipiscium viviparus]|uniref:cell division protein FtsA n=1 Tax=Candidatus Epulonipiscium viviparus TaxID=420336 RepID=UPI00016C0B59|nr:cell division FtsA domain-containing protein [Candidatus Epulopiscium viviparus]